MFPASAVADCLEPDLHGRMRSVVSLVLGVSCDKVAAPRKLVASRVLLEEAPTVAMAAPLGSTMGLRSPPLSPRVEFFSPVLAASGPVLQL